jgi:hypothetical protein
LCQFRGNFLDIPGSLFGTILGSLFGTIFGIKN